MPVSHRGAISFGLVHIPVALHTVIQDNDIHFNQLHREDGSRIKYKKVCSHCGKEVAASDIVKGFEYEKGKFITMTDEDFEAAKTEKDRSVQILHFAALDSIRPVYYDKAYYAIPEAGGDKAYELLRQAMLQENKVAIAKTVMGTKEKLLTIMPAADAILVMTMYFEDEVKTLPKEPAKPAVNEAELEMAKNLISSMTRDFEPAAYQNEYQVRLRQIIEKKINGEDTVAAPEERSGNVIDIMDALKASIEQANKTKKPAAKRPKKGAS
ncbi:MAG: Ku protein [Clostridiales bacterium]|nr:Ku protein [Clostridiales bacterium]